MKNKSKQIAEIILGMRKAYSLGNNAMEWCREYLRNAAEKCEGNEILATLVAYDLQAGSYIAAARGNIANNQRWCRQLEKLISSIAERGDSILEVGVGEATTLSGVLRESESKPNIAMGFDVSWSRVNEGNKWLKENRQEAILFVGDLMNIPLEENSVDIVFSSHSLEPNGGMEECALRECLRVARKAVVLVEPIYELASKEAQERMRHHGYVQGLRETAERLGAKVIDYRLLEYSPNPLNPSGVLCLKKTDIPVGKKTQVKQSDAIAWRCPISEMMLEPGNEYYYAPEVGLAYPVLGEIPLLRAEHCIVASKLNPANSA
jgi:ubiquinone/menaquinone biosynthesis C-methylase UbiE